MRKRVKPPFAYVFILPLFYFYAWLQAGLVGGADSELTRPASVVGRADCELTRPASVRLVSGDLTCCVMLVVWC